MTVFIASPEVAETDIMATHLRALSDLLGPLNYLTHLFAAPEVTAQYLVLSAPAWGEESERAIGCSSSQFAVEVRVTAVAGTPEGVDIMLGRVRRRIGHDPQRLAVGNRHASVQFVRAEVVDVDRDVTIVGTNRHPAYGVDTYLLVSHPI